MSQYIKDPDASLDFAVDWGTSWLEEGDSIVASEWSAEEGITIDSEDLDGPKAIVWLSGGSTNRTYRVTNRITTAAGRVDDRSIHIRVVER
jgi:hypothetical protein